MYIIAYKVHQFEYYLKFTISPEYYKRYETVGLKDNATMFNTKHSAEEIASKFHKKEAYVILF